MSRVTCRGLILDASFPRVSGDEPPGKDLQRYLGLFSPRERG